MFIGVGESCIVGTCRIRVGCIAGKSSPVCHALGNHVRDAQSTRGRFPLRLKHNYVALQDNGEAESRRRRSRDARPGGRTGSDRQHRHQPGAHNMPSGSPTSPTPTPSRRPTPSARPPHSSGPAWSCPISRSWTRAGDVLPALGERQRDGDGVKFGAGDHRLVLAADPYRAGFGERIQTAVNPALPPGKEPTWLSCGARVEVAGTDLSVCARRVGGRGVFRRGRVRVVGLLGVGVLLARLWCWCCR